MKNRDDHAKLFKISCKSDSNVLITGPTGTGKSLLAKKIHENSLRSNKTFVSVNLASLHEGTLESELFGHERGAFTGADQKRVGRLELSQGGTVFLDEVGELSPRLQGRLLEFLQNKTVVPLGSHREVQLDVRVISATHKDLEASVKKGEFREDLFHRLRVISIPLKSLWERREEFDEIVHSCLSDFCRRLGRHVLRISPEVAEWLEKYDWPGNIRELRNVLEYAVTATEGSEIQMADLPYWIFQRPYKESFQSRGVPLFGVAEVPFTSNYQETLENFEKDYLQRALSRNGGRVTRTAQQIGMSKSTLMRRLHAYGWIPLKRGG